MLVLRVGGDLAEAEAGGGFFDFDKEAEPTLPALMRGLRLAAHDPRIEHLYMRVDALNCGWGKVLEVRRHLEYFVESGKEVTVFMEGGGEKEFFLTCGLKGTQVFLPPEGGLSLRGFMSGGSFVRGVLEKIGVDAQVERIGVYKSAGDQLGRKTMSEDQKMVVKSLLAEVKKVFVGSVAATKGMEEEKVVEILDRGIQSMAEYAEEGLITGVKYEGEIEDDLKRRFKAKKGETPENDDEKILKRKLTTVQFGGYVKRTNEKMLGLAGKQKIAVIRAAGAITSGKDGNSPAFGKTIGSESVIKLLRQAGEDDKIKAVVLRVDSPGGSALASDVMFEEVKRLAKKKPVIASMVSVAASGGYYIAMGCDDIVCENAAITGSVGVVTAKLALGELYKKIGFTKQSFSEGKYAELLADERSFNNDEAEYFKKGTEAAYKSFVGKAAESRNFSYDDMHARAQGRVWTGSQALEKGLVDHLGGYWKAIEVAKKAADITDDFVRVEEIKDQPGLLAQLGLGGASAASLTKASADVSRMVSGNEVLALCEVDEAGIGARAGASGMQLSRLQKVFVQATVELVGKAGGGGLLRKALEALIL